MASYTSLPPSFSNKRKVEQLRADAAASFLRMSLRLAAGAGNFSIWSALRDRAEQERLFRLAYTPVNRGRGPATDRAFQGRIWALKPGHLPVASPDYVGGSVGTHRQGRAVDIHPTRVQNWIKSNGRRFGWSWTNGQRLGEHHHFEYEPGLDRYKAEGTPDISGMQRKLGVTVDGKPGTGFVAAVRRFQQANGLTVDGIAGPATQARILGGKAPSAPSPGLSVPVPSPGRQLKAASTLNIDRSKSSPNHNTDRRGHDITEITLHHWGTPSGQSHGGIVNHLCNPAAEVSSHYVVSPGKASQLVDEKHRSWANGDADANSQAITIECDPNDILGTLPILAALIADIRSRHGDLPLVPHNAHVSTQCPGDYLPLLDDIDAMADGATVEVSLSGSAGTPGTVGVDGRLGRETAAELQGRLGVTADGMIGPVTLKALARYLGAPYADGKISRQPEGALHLGNGYRRDVIEVGDGDSQLVRLWQAYVGATIDGRLGEETIERTQIQLNASPASFTTDHASTVKLRTKGVLDRVTRPVKSKAPAFPLIRKPGQMMYYGPASGPKNSVSGKGRNTAVPRDVVQGGRLGWYSKGLQQWQKAVGVTADGRYGSGTEKAAKNLQRKHGLTVDGKIGPSTWAAAWK